MAKRIVQLITECSEAFISACVSDLCMKLLQMLLLKCLAWAQCIFYTPSVYCKLGRREILVGNLNIMIDE
jgi:hypothetical protein